LFVGGDSAIESTRAWVPPVLDARPAEFSRPDS